MTILEAIKSGKAVKRQGWAEPLVFAWKFGKGGSLAVYTVSGEPQ